MNNTGKPITAMMRFYIKEPQFDLKLSLYSTIQR